MTDLLSQLLSLISPETQKQLAQLIEEFKGRRQPGESVMQAVERERQAGNLKLIENPSTAVTTTSTPPGPPAPPAPQELPGPQATPIQPTPLTPTPPTPLTPPTQPPDSAVYRFKDGAAIEKVMSNRYGRNWAASMGINQMDLMRLIGTTPSEEAVQKQLDVVFRQGDGGIGHVTVQTARGQVTIPISYSMIERV